MIVIEFLESVALPLLILFSGTFFLIMGKGLFITKPKKYLSLVICSDRESRRALSLALAGTLGVGNILGVAGALSLGGAGALFWMIVSSLFAMVLKYSETKLAIKTSVRSEEELHGGAMYYLGSRIAGVAFCILCIICSFSLGSSIQSAAAADSVNEVFGLPKIIVTLFMSILCFIVIFGGKRRIFDLTSALIPALTILYALMCIIVIVAYRNRLPDVFSRIISSAFNFRAIGVGGGLSAVRYGIVRGLISNEAGCGTSPIAHSSANGSDSKSQLGNAERSASLGIVEVFVDTTLLCSLTGLALLCVPGCMGGDMRSVLNCFASVFGSISSYLITASIFLFAFATLICWSFYGVESIVYLVGNKCTKKKKNVITKVYIILFCITAGAAGFIKSDLMWAVSDLTVVLMTMLNIWGLINNRKLIKQTA